MQALNIQSDLLNTTALSLQSAPTNNAQENKESTFASLVSAEIEKQSAKEAESSESPKQTAKNVSENEKSSSDTKNISNDEKKVASNTAEKTSESENESVSVKTAKDEKKLVAFVPSTAKKAMKEDVSDEKTAKVASKKDKKSVSKSDKSAKNPQVNAEEASKLLAGTAENATDISINSSNSIATIEEIGAVAADIADVSKVVKQNNEPEIAIPDAIGENVSEEISEAGEALLASAVASLESEDGERSGQVDVSDKRTAQAVKSDTAKKGASLTVRDERTEIAANKAEPKSADSTAEIKSVSENAVEMTMAAANTEATANITSSNNQTAGAAGSNYQAMLANQIQNNAPEFVKAGSIVLRDNNQGTINLILHPESLGNVKVSLQLTDKVIAGQIVVQSQEAYNAFRDSIDSLKQAFAQNGFETANFNLAMGGDMMNGNGGNPGERADAPFVANRAYSDYAESAESIELPSLAYAGNADGVDIVA